MKYFSEYDWTELEDETELYQSLLSTVDNVIDDNKTRLQNMARNLRMYEDSTDDTAFLNCRMLSLGNDLDLDEDESNGYNVIRVCVNTLTNKIGKNKVSPRILTKGASYLIREKVKKADKFIKAAFDHLKVRKEAKKALFDACLHGTGFVKVCNDGEEINVERCMPDEIFVDVHDGYRGDPSKIYEVRYVSRQALKAMVGDDKDKLAAIETAESLPFTQNEHLKAFSVTNKENQNNIPVIEAWSKTCGDVKGRHILAISNCILFEEGWDKDYLPIIPIYYNEPTVGFYSTGIGHELKNLQRNILETDNLIDASIHAMAAPKILINASCGITASQIDDVPGSVLKVTSLNPNMPIESQIKHLTPSAISGEVYNYRAGKIKDAHDQCGVSQMAASGHKPAGLDSGAALREYNDIQTERFVLLGQAWEQIHKEIAKTLFKEMSELGDYEVRSARGSALKTLRLKDLKLDLDSFDVSIYPVSSLPQTPSARLQAVQELAQLGVIAEKDIPDLLDLPDLEEHTTITQAPKRAVDRLIGRILDDPSKSYTINRFLDIEYLLEQLVLHYNYVLSEIDDKAYDNHLAGEDSEATKTEELLDVLLDLINECDAMLQETIAQQAPPPMPGGDPMGGIPPPGGMPPMGGDPSGGMPPPM